jgi:serine/threonine-protein kinase RsbW
MTYSKQPKDQAEEIDFLPGAAPEELSIFQEADQKKVRTLEINSEEEMSKVEAFIDALYEDYRIREDVYGHIMTTVTEAVNNALIHGNKLDPTKKVIIQSRLISSYLLGFSIQDEGPGFDFEASNQDLDTILSKYHQTGNGIGIFLMKSLSDSFKFKGNGNKVELAFHI